MNTETNACPQCGIPLSADAPGGLCPRCVMSMNLAQESDYGMGGANGWSAPSIEELAPRFPQFEFLKLIGKGGMGAVYQVRQKQLDRIVALKVLPPDVGQQPGFAARFAREARALARLNHPGIVTLHEFGDVEDLYFFVMEHVDGATLRQLLDQGRIAPREALAIVPQICDALQFAHDQGIVHRDIKPENILIDRRGRVKVADFGLAKLKAHAADEAVAPGHLAMEGVTQSGNIMGTPPYMAPEQRERPDEVDHRADIYALGVVLYQMLTGEFPAEALEPPSKKVRIDVRLDEIVIKALEGNPELRFQQASFMKTDVEIVAAAAGRTSGPRYRGKRDLNYKSRARIFGLPLLHVTAGLDPETGKERLAKGIIAIGGRALGVVAFGGLAAGGLAVGGVAVGGIAYGGVAAGLLTLGGVALALLIAVGGVAVGTVAMGGSAHGYYAFGGKTNGVYELGANAHDSQAAEFFLPWAQILFANMGEIMLGLIALTLAVSVGIPMAIGRLANLGAMKSANENSERDS